ncbi:MAG: hypothetical protein WC805_02890 [Patescibacteria group bacterium]|jgi:hypothetical protein
MKHQKWLWGALLSLLILGGCGVKTEEPPIVLGKMTQTMSKLEQLEFSGEFNLVGNSTLPLLQGLQDLRITGNGAVNLADINNLRYLLNLIIGGKGSEGNTEIGAELRSFPDCNYFRITRIAVPLGLPFSLSADNKWYQIKSGGQNREWLGSSQPLSFEQMQQIRALLAQSKLFNVVQKFPDDTANGARTYHWQVAVDNEVLRAVLLNWSNITNPTESVDLEKWTAMLSDYDYEFWINKRDYRLMRANIKGWYDDSAGQRADFTIKINLNKFSSIVAIERPANVQEFDLREILGLPLANSLQ